jgi:hypothetical protein
MVLTPLAVEAHQAKARFPGERDRLAAPSGEHVVVNVDSDQPPTHALYVTGRDGNNRRLLLAYERHVTAVWSPDGSLLAVTDFGGSDFSRCLVFDARTARLVVEVSKALKQRYPRERRWSENHHVYFEAERWLDARTLQVKVRGHGDRDPKGFEARYEFRVDDADQGAAGNGP